MRRLRKGGVVVKSLRPLLNLIRAAWLDFKLATINPMAPQLGQLRIERNEIERPTR